MRMLIIASLMPFLFASVAQSQPAATENACLHQNMVDGWKVTNDRTLIVTDRAGKKFTVSLASRCPNPKFNQQLAFSAFSGAGPPCLGHDDYVLVPSGGGDPGRRCLIVAVQAYAAPAGKASCP